MGQNASAGNSADALVIYAVGNIYQAPPVASAVAWSLKTLTSPAPSASTSARPCSRVLHPSTFYLNVSAFWYALGDFSGKNGSG
jgi:hypothetical protein